MPDIRFSLFSVQRTEFKSRGNPLVKLSQLGPGQLVRQLRLPDKNNVEEFFFVGFEIGEQPDLLQHIKTQMLRLINHQYGFTTGAMILKKKTVQRVGQLFKPRRGIRQADLKFLADRGEKVARIQGRIQNNGDVRRVRKLLKQAAVDRGLARAHLARQQDKAAACADPVEQMR